ncbi:LPXTG cell wall anchor domain-containing protein [Cellulomonas triticagri]|uniref:LPXTG cell wall anchor domain-containing protein n=1 Tax=Cellulomonas triticagri TaxID=2483352 RepID=A0A3M2J1Q3_9CELL|nr:LPXTG cell wall anchor domain-containing protein [Cellulomonas triticagri]RMI06734.1 LPXTG cell wall anchor domain-containing protein [Cellulomonas triticagri]
MVAEGGTLSPVLAVIGLVVILVAAGFLFARRKR